MATLPLNVSELLKYANLQIAAEALYNFNAVTNGSTLIPGAIDASGRNVAAANLVTGNLHVTKMTPTEVAWNQLPDLWTVVEHESNTTTGFSGTLFKATRDDPTTGTRKDDLVLSFRSTEFIDDAARDQEATNKLEVSELGWAFGQIDDMRTWYQSLRTKYVGDFAAAAGRLSVTGYSLGGQMATAFNLMYPGAARQVVLFNGAGMGSVGDGSLVTTELKMPEMMSYFHQLRGQSDDPDGLATLMKSAWGRDMYAQLRGLLNVNGLVEADLQALLANALVYLNDRWNTALTDRSLTDYAVALNDTALLQRGLERAYKVAEYAHDAPSLDSGATVTDALRHPAAIPDIVDGKLAIAGESLDCQLAVIASADKYSAKEDAVCSGCQMAFPTHWATLRKRKGSPLANQFDVSGTEMDSQPGYFMVAHSQYRYGSEIKLPIEDQPLYRHVFAAFLSSIASCG